MPRKNGDILEIRVANFGPIAEGSVRLRPLTVFVGPNNTGKSYYAMLIYALLRSFAPTIGFAAMSSSMLARWRRYGERHLWAPLVEFPAVSDKVLGSLQRWSSDVQAKGEMPKGMLLSALPPEVNELASVAIKNSISQFVENLGLELKRCYGTGIGDLVRKVPMGTLSIAIRRDKPLLTLSLSSSDSKLYAVESEHGLTGERIEIPERVLRVLLERRTARTRQVLLPFAVEQLLERVFLRFYQGLWVHAYYLPAARSGILQAHKALASFMVSRAPLAGIERIDVPRLTGVVTDFVGNLLTLERSRKTDLYQIAGFLESEILHGRIDIDVGKIEYPEIYYATEAGKFALHRTSSMVSELAPVILFLKHVVDAGDFLIIEEPEAHLHPETQRALARTVAKLIRAKVKVLVTTHSDYFLEQLSNFIRLTEVDEAERTQRGYSPEDYIRPEEVGAYLFQLSEEHRGTSVAELLVTAQDGIPRKEFTRVAEALYQETVQLDRVISH